MPRLPLGKEKRTIVVSFRVTEEEANELTRLYGHYNKGALAIYKAWKGARNASRN
jgi:hypothetical protein